MLSELPICDFVYFVALDLVLGRANCFCDRIAFDAPLDGSMLDLIESDINPHVAPQQAALCKDVDHYIRSHGS